MGWVLIKSILARKGIRFIFAGIVISITLILLYWYQTNDNKDKEVLSRLNDHIKINDVKLYLLEKQLIELLGEGEYIEGFGGHVRNYIAKKIKIGISEDSDNDYFGRVSSITFSNPLYSIYGIKVGDSKQEAINVLKEKGYEQLEEDHFVNGEYVIAIYGEIQVQELKISFSDKDVSDRNY
ncbi:hypothetical protein ACFSTH_11145 [Paenibacillus yanchengensis]|uniref:Uncharacterized protein n=1 Tax=Paenibacillus yanchengensis TaxID=2035833 RepID=A0ABW4YJV9_9BACL